MIFTPGFVSRAKFPGPIWTFSRIGRAFSSASVQRKPILKELTKNEEISKNKKWQLMASVCLERHPLIAPPPTDLEIRYQEMLRSMEDENSLLSNHELRLAEEHRAEKKATGKVPSIVESGERKIITAQDFEDASIEERKRFKAAPRTSETEDANVQSLNRLLHRKLIFMTPSQYVKDSWRLPVVVLTDGETLIKAAERIIDQCLDITPGALFYGNAPRRLYKYDYPKPVREKTGADGAKVFIFKAELHRNAKVTPRIDQFRWLCLDELKEVIKNPRYHRCLHSFIFE